MNTVKKNLLIYANQNAPDLWGRIEKNLPDRSVSLPILPVKKMNNIQWVVSAAALVVLIAAIFIFPSLQKYPLTDSSSTNEIYTLSGEACEAIGQVSSAADSVPLAGIVDYGSLQIPPQSSDISQQGLSEASSTYTMAATCVVVFSEELLKNTALSFKGTVLNAYSKEYNTQSASDGLPAVPSQSTVYEVRIDELYYAQNGEQAGDIIKVEETGIMEDLRFDLTTNGQYILCLRDAGTAQGDFTRDGHYCLVYPYAPQIEVTLENQYLFSDDWKSLINDKTQNVVYDDDARRSASGGMACYLDRMKLRSDDGFIPDFKALLAQYKG